MSDAVKIAAIAALPAALAAIVSFIGLLIGRRNTQKIDVIHILVNSQLTAVKSELVIAQQKIGSLQEFIMEQQDRQEQK
jgi:hypothetical protein